MSLFRRNTGDVKMKQGLGQLADTYATLNDLHSGDEELRETLIQSLLEELTARSGTVTLKEVIDGWDSYEWSIGPYATELQISPMVLGGNQEEYLFISATCHVGSAPDEILALGYVNAHNGIASTSYSWVYDPNFNLHCSTSVILANRSKSAMQAAELLSDMFSAALGKASWFPTEGAESGYIPVVEPTSEEILDIVEQKVFTRSLMIRNYGDNTVNPWAAIDPLLACEWVQKVVSKYLGEEAGSAIGSTQYLTQVPFFELLNSDLIDKIDTCTYLTVAPDTHPYIGPGLRVTLEFTHEVASVRDGIKLCNRLNQHELTQAGWGVAAHGSWMLSPSGSDDETVQICHTVFYPSYHFAWIDLDAIIEGEVRRAQFTSSILGSWSNNGTQPPLDGDSGELATQWAEAVSLPETTVLLESTLKSESEVSAKDGDEVEVRNDALFNAAYDGGAGWVELRKVIQKRLTLDEEWCVDEEERLLWWPTLFPMEVDVPCLCPPAPDGVTRRMVRVRSVLGTVAADVDRDKLLTNLAVWNGSKAGGVAIVDSDNKVVVTFIVPFGVNMAHPARAITNAMALQSASALSLGLSLFDTGLLEVEANHHPVSGARSEIDEIVRMSLPSGVGSKLFNMAEYIHADVRESYEELMLSGGELELGWTDSEAVYVQRRDAPDVAVGMGIIDEHPDGLGSGVRYVGTFGFAIDANHPELLPEICNAFNLHLASMAPGAGITVPMTASAQASKLSEDLITVVLESYLPADVFHEYNSTTFTPEQRAGVLGHYALMVLTQAGCLYDLITMVAEARDI
jgi:hypothetical protein